MKSRIQSIFKIILFGIMILSCDQEEIITEKVQIITDKISYIDLQDIIVTVSNNSGELLEFYICNGKQFPTYELQRYGAQWTTIDASVCNGFSSYCCGSFK